MAAGAYVDILEAKLLCILENIYNFHAKKRVNLMTMYVQFARIGYDNGQPQQQRGGEGKEEEEEKEVQENEKI